MASPPLRQSSLEASSLGSIDSYISYIKNCHSGRSPERSYHYQLVRYLQSDLAPAILPVPSELRLQSRNGNLSRLEFGWFSERRAKILDPSTSFRLSIVEGLPSPGCVAHLGSEFSIRPEFFLSNLEFLHKSPRADGFFEEPTLPTKKANTAHLTVPTLARGIVDSGDTTCTPQTRLRANKACSDWENDVLSRRKYGSSRFRRIHLHDSQFFSLEQKVSLAASKISDTCWAAVLLSDQGYTYHEDSKVPWSSYTPNRRAPYFLPIIPYNSKACQENKSDRLTRTTSPHEGDVLDVREILNDLSPSERQWLQTDPFALLSKILMSINLAWNQMLNFVEEYIEQPHLGLSDMKLLGRVMEQLQFNHTYIDRVRGHIEENKALTEYWADNCFTTRSDEPHLRDRDVAQRALTCEYKHLLRRCKRMSRVCKHNIHNITDSISFLRNEKRIEQTDQINTLTKLAFAFIPVSSVAALFGMNVRQLQHFPSISVFFAVMIPFTVIIWVFAGWTRICAGLRQLGALGKNQMT